MNRVGRVSVNFLRADISSQGDRKGPRPYYDDETASLMVGAGVGLCGVGTLAVALGVLDAKM